LTGLSRLSVALNSGEVTLPAEGRIAVFAPRAGAGHDLSSLPMDRCHVITGFRPDYDHYTALGHACDTAPEGRYAAAVVFVTRASALSEALIAEAAEVTDGPVIVNGAKTDGIETILRACRKRTDIAPPLSKAHGKVFQFTAGPEFANWARPTPQQIEGGFVTRPGLFSADGVDPGSALLADNLPDRMGARVADLGAGWGYLAARALERDTIKEMHLVEGEHAALECARLNVTDPRAQFHWHDATRWQPADPVDTVITNPPFHTGRTPDPALGLAFVTAAARILAPKGQLFLVANRHLPYETQMQRQFREVREIAGNSRFKLLHAARPAR